MRLLILGGGNMGGSILHSLEKIKDISPKNILLIEKDEQKRINLSKNYNNPNTTHKAPYHRVRGIMNKSRNF